MNQRGFSFKKCMVGLVLAIAMVIQTPVSGFAADVCTQSNVVQAEGKVSKTRVNNVNAYYLGIPENVRQYLEDQGWTFICSAQSFGKRYGYTGSILALTVYNDKVIYIDNRKNFAEAFQIYVQQPENLQTYCPQTYEYIQNIVSGLRPETTEN